MQYISTVSAIYKSGSKAGSIEVSDIKVFAKSLKNAEKRIEKIVFLMFPKSKFKFHGYSVMDLSK